MVFANALLALMTGAALAAPLSQENILQDADARIQKHRTGQVSLKIIGPDGQPIKADQKVQIEQTNHAFLFGCNIYALNCFKTPEDNAIYEKHFAELFNYATLSFYWWDYENQQGKTKDAKTVQVVKWCKEHNVTTKGHPLVWNWIDPKWLPDDIDLVMDLQLNRIGRCVDRFKGDINIWDVVNEATQYERDDAKKNAPKLTGAITKMGVGPFVRAAFKKARQANPDAVLIINDYDVSENYAKRVLAELNDDRDKPLYDIIGIQSHQHGGPWPIEKIWDVCERFARFGKPLHFTETTFLSGKNGWELTQHEPGFKWPSTPEDEKRQADEAARFYTVLFSHPAVEAITWWDFSDQHAWQQAPAGMLGRDMQPKLITTALHKLIKNDWWTRTAVTAGDKGIASFRGFFGDYKLTIGSGDKKLTGTFRFDKKTDAAVEVRVK